MSDFFSAFRFLKKVILPEYCPLCLKEYDEGGICKACYGILEGAAFKDGAFDFDIDGYTVRCRSVFSYKHGHVKKLVRCMKENPDNGVFMFAAAYLAGEVRSLGLEEEGTVITYVPRSKIGLRENGFDQSYLLARAVSRIIPTLECGRLLERRGKSRAQKSLAAKEREENVKGKFRAVETEASPKNIIIADDMYTTGSSIMECAAVLRRKYPNADIFCLTVAKNA